MAQETDQMLKYLEILMNGKSRPDTRNSNNPSGTGTVRDAKDYIPTIDATVEKLNNTFNIYPKTSKPV